MEKSPNIRVLTRLETDKLQFIKKIMEWGLLPKEGEYPCRNCKQPMTLLKVSRSLDGYMWHCYKSRVINKRRQTCRIQVSIRKGTFFEKSHLSFSDILGFVSLWMDSAKMVIITRQVEISLRTAVDWASFCREVALHAMIEHQEPIGGVGKVVEIDESKFTQRKSHVGRATPDNWVFGGIERGSGKVFMISVQDQTKETLINVINKWILPGTKIISNCWKSYSSLASEGFEHETVNHSVNFVNPVTRTHTQTIEASWRAAKVTITPPNRKSKSLAGNLARFMLLKKAKAEAVDPILLFYKMAGQLYNPLVEREVSIARPGTVEIGEDEIAEEEEEEDEIAEEEDEEN